MASSFLGVGLGFSLAIVYERTTPPGGLHWSWWAVMAAVYFIVMLLRLKIISD